MVKGFKLCCYCSISRVIVSQPLLSTESTLKCTGGDCFWQNSTSYWVPFVKNSHSNFFDFAGWDIKIFAYMNRNHIIHTIFLLLLIMPCFYSTFNINFSSKCIIVCITQFFYTEQGCPQHNFDRNRGRTFNILSEQESP